VLCGLPENKEWQLAREFIWGADHTEPLALIGQTGEAPAVFHYVQDALGSVVALTDAADPNAQPDPIPPAVVERYEYAPYGRTYIEDAAGVRHAASALAETLTGRGADVRIVRPPQLDEGEAGRGLLRMT
jgi:hypothetical protein